MKADPIIIREMERLLDQWKTEISQSTLKQSAQDTYVLHPSNFVRWVKDDFPIRGYKAQ